MHDLDRDATFDPLPSTASGRLVPPTTESGRMPRWDARGGWAPGPYVTEFDDASFERGVVRSRLPAIVDFWAENCIPCTRQANVLEQAGRALLGRVRVGRLNVYENPDTTKRFGIKGVPHLMVFKEGQVVLELLGDHSLEQLLKHLGDVGIS